MLGLKRGTVVLTEHKTEWEKNAADMIKKLKEIFGDKAADIQHIGSTAIRSIKAKPIVDIAVGVDSFDVLNGLLPMLERSGIYKSNGQPFHDIVLFSKDDDKTNFRTYNIQVIIYNSRKWHCQIYFRDYMNSFPERAAEYDSLKTDLGKLYPDDLTAYNNGKNDFIRKHIEEAEIYFGFKSRLNLIEVTQITKGWSGDRKYCARTDDGTKYLLRISPPEQYDRKKIEFRMMQRVAALGVPMCQPVEFGTCDEGVYSLQSWIEGNDAEDVISAMSETEQYVYGLQSGRILKKIHSVPAPETQEDWETRFNRKIDRKIKMYNDCPIKYENGQAFIDYINSNRRLLKNRPQCYQHGDYHIGNMMIDRDGKLQIIDFDRDDFGDPWEEFNRIVWCAQKVPMFASGMVNGYFENAVPDDFWRLLALYISSNTLSSVPWAIPFGQKEIDTMLNQAKEVLSWYDNMKNHIPTWYFKGFYLQYIDGIPYMLKSAFDFDFIRKFGKVFKVFDNQDSGNICFGTEKDGARYFIKFAGAPTERYDGNPYDAVVRLKATVPVYKALRHKNLIEYITSEEIGGGFAVIFKWADGECMGRMYPASRQKFMTMPTETKLHVFREVLSFFNYIASAGYVAIDFYDSSIMYDFESKHTTICDIDFFRKMPCTNDMGRMWGSSRFMSPEEFKLGAVLDEITNVYTAGATAFALFADYNRGREAWTLSDELYQIALKAVSNEREERQQSVKQFVYEWEKAITQ